MLVAAAVCPQPPLLVPEVASGAAPELAAMRSAAVDAVDRLARTDPDLVLAVAAGYGSGAGEARFGGTFRRFGVDLVVGGDALGEPSVGLLIARWLVDGCASMPLSLEGWEIGADTPLEECRAVGRSLAMRSARVGLLVMGDGSARHSEKAPGYLDERAGPFDEGIARALAEADSEALATIDPSVARSLLVAGRAPWQVLAGAVGADGREWRAELLASAAPYGVGYFTAFWEPCG
jgi:hypothetical protein